MNPMSKTIVTLIAVMAAAATNHLSAQVSTPVVGFLQTQIKGVGSTGQSQFFTLVPVQLSKAPVFRGEATASGSSTLSLGVGSLVSGAYNAGSYPTHYVRIESGTGAGRISDIQSNLSNSITTADDLSAYFSAASSISIIPHTKLTDVLGASGSQIIAGGTGASSADNVYLVGPDGSFNVYYYKTGVGAGLKTSGNQDATGLVVYPGEAVLVGRRQASDASSSVIVSGQLSSTNTLVNVAQGFNATAGGLPVAFTLSNLTSLVSGGAGASTADNVYVIDSASGQMTFYYYKTGVGAGWRNAANSTVSASTDISSGFVLYRKASSSFDIVQTPTW